MKCAPVDGGLDAPDRVMNVAWIEQRRLRRRISHRGEERIVGTANPTLPRGISPIGRGTSGAAQRAIKPPWQRIERGAVFEAIGIECGIKCPGCTHTMLVESILVLIDECHGVLGGVCASAAAF